LVEIYKKPKWKYEQHPQNRKGSGKRKSRTGQEKIEKNSKMLEEKRKNVNYLLSEMEDRRRQTPFGV